jgi:hypothetical protein
MLSEVNSQSYTKNLFLIDPFHKFVSFYCIFIQILSEMAKFLPTLLLLLVSTTAYAQLRYAAKVETGYLSYQYRTIIVEPGPNWRGYNLKKNQSGIDLNWINGVLIQKQLYLGLGVGYTNFDGINGYSVFTDFDGILLKTKLSPLLSIKAGYNHIWNQYEKGTGTGLVELSIGLNYNVSRKSSLYLKSGILWVQQAQFIPIRAGIRF